MLQPENDFEISFGINTPAPQIFSGSKAWNYSLPVPENILADTAKFFNFSDSICQLLAPKQCEKITDFSETR